MKKMVNILLFPTIESHALCFLPLYYQLVEASQVTIRFLIIEDAIPYGRQFILPPEVLQHRVKLKEFKREKQQFGKIDLLLVGNDAAPPVYRVIHALKKQGGRVVLIQDGWLDPRNIRKPIHLKPSKLNPLKALVRKALVSKYSPFKFNFYGFIGQHADYFFLYSDEARQNFLTAGVLPHQIYVVGSTRHTLMRQQLGSSITAMRQQSSADRVIVFFSTPTYNVPDREAMLLAFSWVNDLYADSKIIIKPHPSEDRKGYQELLAGNPHIDLFDGSFNELIQSYNISMSFCFNSTVLFDMLLLRIPIIQLAPLHMFTKANYHADLPMVRTGEILSNVIKQYNMPNTTQTAVKYLADIDERFDSVDETVSQLLKLSENN